ncbi:acriflavin resistance protein B [Salmonella enterica subsp. enterica serovar Pullorum]|nr:acriflavin resistance protein B [Salmonella enterica subsp. enterica serovar Pullorum]
MPNFFIDRPIFAWVIAIIIMLAGGLAILKLPVAQYPTIAPPAVTISATYPGADAKTVQDTVTQVIEQNMNGIDNLMYMSSNSDSTGTVQITLTFESGTDADIAQVQVQNKLQLAMPLLPQEVQQQGVSVEKSSSSFLMVVGVINTDGTMDPGGYFGLRCRQYERSDQPYLWGGRRSAVWFAVCDAYLDESDRADQNTN